MSGQIPPNSPESEQAVLAESLLRPERLEEVADLLVPEDFFGDPHQMIWRGIMAVHSLGETVDVASVATWLRAREQLKRMGGAQYLAYLITEVPAAVEVRRHAERIKAMACSRGWIRRCQTLAAKGYGDGQQHPAAYVDAVAAEFAKGLDESGHSELVSFDELVCEEVRKSANLQENPDQMPGVKTGSPALDEKTGGHHDGDLTIVAGRPGCGKTALAVSTFARDAAEDGSEVVIFSHEMPKEQVAARLIASESGVDLRRLRQGRLTPKEWKDVEGCVDRLCRLQLHIDDTTPLSPLQIRARTRRHQMRAEQRGSKVVLVIVDYLQLLAGDGQNREQEVASIARGLKLMAKALGVPVIALSQLNRQVENRSCKRPMMSDLRESGAIEQDADAIYFLYRPGYYMEQEGKADTSGGRTELIISKQRNGPTGSIELKFYNGCARFGEWHE